MRKLQKRKERASEADVKAEVKAEEPPAPAPTPTAEAQAEAKVPPARPNKAKVSPAWGERVCARSAAPVAAVLFLHLR